MPTPPPEPRNDVLGLSIAWIVIAIAMLLPMVITGRFHLALAITAVIQIVMAFVLYYQGWQGYRAQLKEWKKWKDGE